MYSLQLKDIGEQFNIDGTFSSYHKIERGNINTTYQVEYCLGDEVCKYIFQSINSNVFTEPVQIMENIARIDEYLQMNYPDEVFLQFLKRDNGLNYYIDQEGVLWRVCEFIESVIYSHCDDLEVIEAVGDAIGHFQKMLADFDVGGLHETIPDFHNTTQRMKSLFADAKLDGCGRVNVVKEELEYLLSMQEAAGRLSLQYEAGEIPSRVTHNDTKSDNVLFDPETGRPITLIDLDTVMPGLAINDFADAVRSIANNGAEDESDLSKVYLDVDKFRALCKGYLGRTRDILTDVEIQSMVQAVLSLVIEQASRFLDDYINGDTYFKINYPEHNLNRARCHIQLAKDIEKKYNELCKIVSES